MDFFKSAIMPTKQKSDIKNSCSCLYRCKSRQCFNWPYRRSNLDYTTLTTLSHFPVLLYRHYTHHRSATPITLKTLTTLLTAPPITYTTQNTLTIQCSPTETSHFFVYCHDTYNPPTAAQAKKFNWNLFENVNNYLQS